jgi:hypothetical protein
MLVDGRLVSGAKFVDSKKCGRLYFTTSSVTTHRVLMFRELCTWTGDHPDCERVPQPAGHHQQAAAAQALHARQQRKRLHVPTQGKITRLAAIGHITVYRSS